MLDEETKELFLSLFVRSGYVLNFTSEAFDNFTLAFVNIRVQNKYGLSKGKSLKTFLYDEEIDDSLKTKLLSELLSYYEKHYEYEYKQEYKNELVGVEAQNMERYYLLYLKCKKKLNEVDQIENTIKNNMEDAKDFFSSEYISQNVNLMLETQSTNPANSIGLAKNLIESCCKTILSEIGINYDKNDNLNDLTKKVTENIQLLPNSFSKNDGIYKTVNKILGNLKQIPCGLAEMRNLYGNGHGKEANFVGLDETCAKLAIACATTYVTYVYLRFKDSRKGK